MGQSRNQVVGPVGQLDSELVGQCGKRADIRCDNAGPGVHVVMSQCLAIGGLWSCVTMGFLIIPIKVQKIVFG